MGWSTVQSLAGRGRAPANCARLQSPVHRGDLQRQSRSEVGHRPTPLSARFSASPRALRTTDPAPKRCQNQRVARCVAEWGTVGYSGAAFSGPDGRFVARVSELDADVQIHAAKKGYPAAKSPIIRLASGERMTMPLGLATFVMYVPDDRTPGGDLT